MIKMNSARLHPDYLREIDEYNRELDLDIVLFNLICDDLDEIDEQKRGASAAKRRRQIAPMFANRKQEGALEILIHRHLIDDDTKFKEYFRLSPHLFKYVLNAIKNDIHSVPNNTHPEPVSPDHKLYITLR